MDITGGADDAPVLGNDGNGGGGGEAGAPAWSECHFSPPTLASFSNGNGSIIIIFSSYDTRL